MLLIDSGVYRNDPTRHMHDVIGTDGKPRESDFQRDCLKFKLLRGEPDTDKQRRCESGVFPMESS